MVVRLLTLDCANTLLRGRWDPVAFALWAAREAGLCLPRHAGERYGASLRQHYPTILAANRTGDEAVVREAYIHVGEAWLDELGIDPALAPEVVDAAARLLVSKELFEPFEDTVPFLLAARRRGIRLAVVSNWDASLPRVLAAHGLLELVDEVYASLVVGAEKPDPTMLRLAMDAAGISAEETWHIGDDREDDLGAARNAGVRGVLIDRKSFGESPPGKENTSTIRNLMEVFAWID